MRPLGFLILGLLALAGALLLRQGLHRRKQRPRLIALPGGKDIDALEQRLTEAAISFNAAAGALDPSSSLRAALTSLSDQCAALAARQADGGAFGSAPRAAIIRLLMALYPVVERVTAIACYGDPAVTDPSLDSATALLTRSTETLGNIAEKADETALRHLEADLDVLRERLDRPG
jgi:hypothetical protein